MNTNYIDIYTTYLNKSNTVNTSYSTHAIQTTIKKYLIYRLNPSLENYTRYLLSLDDYISPLTTLTNIPKRFYAYTSALSYHLE